MKRIPRLVVRPDYQGLGIGKALLNAVASKIQGDGYRLSIVTSLGVFAKAMSKDPSWRLTRQGFLTGGTRRAKKGLREVRSCRRLTASFEYVGNGAERGG
jgi:GNAT superfamily N-acetyltransferase